MKTYRITHSCYQDSEDNEKQEICISLQAWDENEALEDIDILINENELSRLQCLIEDLWIVNKNS